MKILAILGIIILCIFFVIKKNNSNIFVKEDEKTINIHDNEAKEENNKNEILPFKIKKKDFVEIKENSSDRENNPDIKDSDVVDKNHEEKIDQNHDFENHSDVEIENFLKDFEIKDIKNHYKSFKKIKENKDIASQFKGLFEGGLVQFTNHGLFEKDKKIHVKFYLNGQIEKKEYEGTYDIKMYRDDTNISHLSGEGKISNIRIGETYPSLIISDYQDEPSYFQFFISESGQIIIGNYYESHGKKTVKTATFQLHRKGL